MVLVLASASPRRLELLRAAGFDPAIAPADVDESLLPGERGGAAALRLASVKARTGALSSAVPAVVLGADTIVELDGESLGKPRDPSDARRMMARLAGRRHEVHTGVALVESATGREERELATTAIELAPLTPAELDWYASTGEGLDKAGGYAVQGRASLFVTALRGSYTNVVGLPMDVVYRLLGRLGHAVGRGLDLG